MPTEGHDLLLIARSEGETGERRELLVPCVPAIVREVDFEDGRMIVRLPEGLQESGSS